jgi:AsmA protein
MAHLTRFKIGLFSALCLLLIITGYLFAKPSIINERSIRTYLTQHLTEWTGAIVTIDGSTSLSYFPRLTMVVSNVRLTDIKHVPALREIRAKRLKVRLGLWSIVSGTPVVDRITLIEPHVKSSSVARVTDVSSDPNKAPDLIQALTTAPFDQVVVEKGVVTVSGPESSEDFTDVNVKFQLRNASGAHSSHGTFVWREKTVTFSYDGGSPSQIVKAVKMPVTLTINGDLVSAEIEGEATVTDAMKVTGNLTLGIPNLPRFAKWTGVLIPDAQENGDFSADGTFHWAGLRIGFDEGSFILDDNKALGALELEFGGPRPQIEGTLALQKLDLTKYFETEAETKPTAKKTKSKSVDVDFPLLHHLNIDLRISTTELSVDQLNFGQSAISFSLKSGRLMADLALFDICGGNGNGRLEFDATVPDSAIRVTGKMTGVSTKTCVEIFTSDSAIEGTAFVSADVTSKGRTAGELLNSLGGKVSISMNEGQAEIDIPKLISNLQTGPAKGWEVARGSPTSFQSLDGDFLFRHGGIYTNSLSVNLGTKELKGEGTVDLAGRGMDIRLKMNDHPPQSDPAAEPKPSQNLAGAIVIKGPWSQPNFSLEPSKSSAHVTTPQITSKTAQLGNN